MLKKKILMLSDPESYFNFFQSCTEFGFQRWIAVLRNSQLAWSKALQLRSLLVKWQQSHGNNKKKKSKTSSYHLCDAPVWWRGYTASSHILRVQGKRCRIFVRSKPHKAEFVWFHSLLYPIQHPEQCWRIAGAPENMCRTKEGTNGKPFLQQKIAQLR